MQPIDIVNEYRKLTGKDVGYAKNELSAQKYMAWCDRNSVDAMGFMKARIFLAKEGDRPIPGISMLPSKALLETDAWFEVLDRAEGVEQDKKFIAEELGKVEDRARATLLAATPAQEKFKHNHRFNRFLCKADIQFSGGYHPKSTECQSCHQGGACASKLNREHGFDVVMLRLREGHIGYVKIQ